MSSRILKFWKCSIYFYLIFFAVTGLFLGSLTTFVLIQSFGLRQFYDPIQTPIYFLYAPTFLIFLGSFMGWKSVKRKNTILLKCFSILQGLIIVLELAGSIWNFIAMQFLHEAALPVFQEKFTELSKDHKSDIWDAMQRKLKCCGIHGAFDYKTLNIVPFSCCNQASSAHYPAFCVSVHHVGCLDAFTDNLSRQFAILAAVSAIVALFQIPGVLASWYFAVRIRRERTMDRRNIMSQKSLLNKSNKPVQIEGSLTQETAA